MSLMGFLTSWRLETIVCPPRIKSEDSREMKSKNIIIYRWKTSIIILVIILESHSITKLNVSKGKYLFFLPLQFQNEQIRSDLDTE